MKTNLVKSLVIFTLVRVNFYKGAFCQGSLQHKIGWRPAKKICPFSNVLLLA
jgi:hypothetical protein